MKLVIFLLIGALQTLIGHLSGLDNGLPHMQFGTNWWLYIPEGLFYSGFWSLFYLSIVSAEERSTAEYKAIMRRKEERENETRSN